MIDVPSIDGTKIYRIIGRKIYMDDVNNNCEEVYILKPYLNRGMRSYLFKNGFSQDEIDEMDYQSAMNLVNDIQKSIEPKSLIVKPNNITINNISFFNFNEGELDEDD